MKECLPNPSVSEVNRYLRLWEELDNYREQEDALNVLFKMHPYNTEENKAYVLLKVVALNHFYSTNIFNVYAVARHIMSISNFDKRLQGGDLSVVEDLRNKNKNGTGRDLYSFATKYCSHHVPKKFPIYDRYVHRVLDYFQKKNCFAGEDPRLTRYNMNVKDVQGRDEVPLRKDYSTFKGVIESFRAHFNLQQFDLKQIDQYLWQLGKDWFPNQCQPNAKMRLGLKAIMDGFMPGQRFYVDLKSPDRVLLERDDSEDCREIGRERAALMKYEERRKKDASN